jgi:hypothetical protein
VESASSAVKERRNPNDERAGQLMITDYRLMIEGSHFAICNLQSVIINRIPSDFPRYLCFLLWHHQEHQGHKENSPFTSSLSADYADAAGSGVETTGEDPLSIEIRVVK